MKEMILTIKEIADLFDNLYSTEWIRHVFYCSDFAPYRVEIRPLRIRWNDETKRIFIDIINKRRKVPFIKKTMI